MTTRDTKSRTIELGTTMPHSMRGTIYEDFLPQLRGRKAMQVFREMSTNDATLGAGLYVIEQYARQVSWTVEGEDEATVEALQAEIAGLPVSFDDFLSAALSEIPYGWSMFEIVYARRDTGFGWDRLAFRPQTSLHDWQLDEHGDVEVFVQDAGNGQTVPIPIEKLVHFRTSTATGRPEGNSWLRRAYRAWFFKHRIEDFLGIGIERDLNGIPLAEIPLEVILEDGDELAAMKKIVTDLRVDDMAGVVWPNEYDENKNQLYKLSLLSSQGRPKVDAFQVWRAFAQDMASVLLTEFLQLGRDAVGSRALGESKVSTFATALEALLDQLEEQFHRQATMRLAELNGWGEIPRLKHGPVEPPNLDELGQLFLRLGQGGAFELDENDETEAEVKGRMFELLGVTRDEAVDG